METCWTASQAYEHLSPRERRDRKRADSAYFRLIGGQVTKGSDHHEALKEALYYYLKIVEPDTFLELEAYPESRYFAPLGSGPPEENYSLWQYCPDVQMVGRLGKQLRGRKDRFTKRPNIWLEIEMHPHRVCEKLGWLVVFAQSDEFVPPDMIVFGVPSGSLIKEIRYRRQFNEGDSISLSDFQTEFLEAIRKLSGLLLDCEIRLYEMDLKRCKVKRLL